MTCLSSPVILFIVPRLLYPLVWTAQLGQQRNQLFVNGVFRDVCSGLNDISTRSCFCNNISTTRISGHLRIFPGFVGYFSPELRR